MAEEKKTPKRPVTPDTSEYSSSQAAETRPHSEHRTGSENSRLIPGGGAGADTQSGMPAMDREEVPSKGDDPGLTNYGDSPRRDE